MRREYDGTFWGRKTCYSITDISGTCNNCRQKFFVSRKSVLDCMKIWHKKYNSLPSKGIYVVCHCKRSNHQINTPGIILEVLKG